MKPKSNSLGPLQEALRDLLKWWRHEKISGILIGGVAVAILGRPRATRDIDALLWLDEKQWLGFLQAGQQFGFVARLPDPLAFAREARMLLVTHVRSAVDIDMSLGSLAFERQAVERRIEMKVAQLKLPLATPEDLIVMKAVAQRPRDLADIDGLIDAHPKLDRRRIRKHLRDFAGQLDAPEMFEDLEARFAQRRPRR